MKWYCCVSFFGRHLLAQKNPPLLVQWESCGRKREYGRALYKVGDHSIVICSSVWFLTAWNDNKIQRFTIGKKHFYEKKNTLSHTHTDTQSVLYHIFFISEKQRKNKRTIKK